MSLRKDKVESVKKLLLSRRESLAADLRAATHEFIETEASYTDTLDQAAADTDRSFALQLKNRERNILWEIDGALRRIDSGDFGDCERCGEEISEARIKAFPFTTLCIDCKTELESEQNRFQVRE
jgi:DnaK suppressor protein